MKRDALGHGHGCWDRIRTSQDNTQILGIACVHEELCVLEPSMIIRFAQRSYIGVDRFESFHSVSTCVQRGTLVSTRAPQSAVAPIMPRGWTTHLISIFEDTR